MKIFLTGGTGFIGSHVLEELVKAEHEVVVLARNLKKTRLFSLYENVSFVIGDLNNDELILENLKGCDAVIHIALFWGETETSILSNDTHSTVKLFEMAEQAGAKRFIYTSSTAAMGYKNSVCNEEVVLDPEDHYGAAKAASEMFLRSLSKKSNMVTTIIRPGYTFGNPVIKNADMEQDSRFRDIVLCCRDNKDFSITKNDGTQFISAKDLSKIYMKSLEQESKFEIYLGLSTEFISWEEIAQTAILLCNSKSQINFEDKGYSNTPNLFSVDKIDAHFGFKFISRYKIREHVRYIYDNL